MNHTNKNCYDPRCGLTLNIENLRVPDRTPLYYQYHGSDHPQPAFIELNKFGEVTAGFVAHTENETPDAVWYGCTHRFYVAPDVFGRSLSNFLESPDVRGVLARIYLGHELYWEGGVRKGRLDKDAKIARDELIEKLRTLDKLSASSTAIQALTPLPKRMLPKLPV